MSLCKPLVFLYLQLESNYPKVLFNWNSRENPKNPGTSTVTVNDLQ